MNGSPQLKVLIADDNNSDRLILQAIVKKQGHYPILAEDGVQAVKKFKEELPDIVLLDALMPEMDGYEAARIIKRVSGEKFTPIIFLTSLKEASALAACLEAGGDDFLTKPYNRIILQAKISAFNRMRKMHATLQQQRDEIQLHKEHLTQEQEVAKKVFDNVAHSGCLSAANIHHIMSPMAIFNGDMILAARKPSGGMFVMLGDFTGHGLPAAIGAMPAAEIFYGMANKGFGLEDIIKEINHKLKHVLPVGVFCCACMIDISFRSERIKLWNGGLPEAVIYRSKTGEAEVIPSEHLPLGVVSNSQFDSNFLTFDLEHGDKIYMWSDGILEASNADNEMFGVERVLGTIKNQCKNENVLDSLYSDVNEFVGDQHHDDDLSVLEVLMMREDELQNAEFEHLDAVSTGPVDWSLEYEMRPTTLKEFNPLPLMLHIIMEVPGLRPHSGKIYTILAELFSNAFEHGVLKLDSALKLSPEGFATYYQARDERMSHLDNGYVRFKLDHSPSDSGGTLSIGLIDSGEGFDFGLKRVAPNNNGNYCGRGLPLISDLCDSIQYFGNGNEIQVVYKWANEG